MRLSSSILALMIVGCGAEPPSATVITAPVAAAPVVAAPTPAPAPEVGPLGVDACDTYVDLYRRCIDDALPASERPAHARVLAGQRLAWARAQQDATADLERACVSARAAARVALPQCRAF